MPDIQKEYTAVVETIIKEICIKSDFSFNPNVYSWVVNLGLNGVDANLFHLRGIIVGFMDKPFPFN